MSVLRNVILGPGGSAPARAWIWTAALAAGAYLVRLWLQPVLGSSLAFSSFYPVVILAAYAFGRGPAIAAALVCGAAAWWSFVLPVFAFKATPNALAGLLFFAVTSSVAIVVITGLTRALGTLSRELGRAQAVADSHAGLFRELNERITHHMRLVAGVLALQARGEPEPQVADGLRKAMERSLLIARIHRELGGRAEEAVHFDAFAAALARAVCSAKGQPPERVEVEPSGIVLQAGEATSLGVALAECLSALLDRPGTLRLRLGSGGREAEVAISEAGEATGALVSVTNGYLLRAMAEQLGAAVSLRADAGGSALVLSLPREPATAAGQSGTLH